MKTRLSPRLRSYVCRDLPTEVVIWKVVLPSGMEVKETSVGDTSPTVWVIVSGERDAPCAKFATYSERGKDGRSSSRSRLSFCNCGRLLPLHQGTVMVGVWHGFGSNRLYLESSAQCRG